jgi:glycosyltransferase involved in cell wall biosynthesis
MSSSASAPADLRGDFGSPRGAAEPIVPGSAGALHSHLDISVVVPTYRRPALLAACLNALCQQDFPADRYEIVVCDDGPDEATRTCAEHLAEDQAARGLTLRYVPVTRTQGPAGARNVGWRLARSPLIAFTDDDTLPDPHWLRAGVAALAQDAAAAAGTILVPLPPLPTDYEADASGLERAEFATANAFVARSFLSMTGGFDERFTTAWREDSDLQFTLMRARAKIVRASDAVVVHPVRPARWGVSIAQQRKSQFDALLYRKHPELFRKRIRARPPLLYYAILCAALAALMGGAAGNASLASGGAVAWFVLTAYFCVMRLRGRDRSWRHIAEMAWTSIPVPFLSIFWRLYGAVRFKVFFL